MKEKNTQKVNDSYTLDTTLTREYCITNTNEQYHEVHLTALNQYAYTLWVGLFG